MKMVLIDQEIDKLVSKKKLIDIRLTELYEAREDAFIDYETQNKHIPAEELEKINFEEKNDK